MSVRDATDVRVSVSELRRVLPDALRVMGTPLGQADSIAEMAIWTATQTDAAIGFLRRRRAQILWRPRPRAVISARSESVVEIDARGASLLELGPCIFDCAVAQATGPATLTARVHQTYGGIFLNYLVWRARAQGFWVDVVKRCGDASYQGRAEFGQDALILAIERLSDPPQPALPDAYLHALRHGIYLTREDFDFVMSQFEMLRVPTSERSRSHAG